MNTSAPRSFLRNVIADARWFATHMAYDARHGNVNQHLNPFSGYHAFHRHPQNMLISGRQHRRAGGATFPRPGD